MRSLGAWATRCIAVQSCRMRVPGGVGGMQSTKRRMPMRRWTCAACLLLGSFAALAAALPMGQPPAPRPTAAPRVLPGVQPGGAILLPNQWSLRPVGKQLPLGDFPVNLAMHPSGLWLAVLHAGHGDHEITILDLKREKTVGRVVLEQTFYGLSFAPDGKQLFASGGEFGVVHAYEFEGGFLGRHRALPLAQNAKERFIPGGISVDAAGQTLFVAGTWGDGVCLLPLSD